MRRLPVHPLRWARLPVDAAVKQLTDQVPDEYLFTVIKDGGTAVGKNAAMPAWRSQLDDRQIRDIVAYIRTLAQY